MKLNTIKSELIRKRVEKFISAIRPPMNGVAAPAIIIRMLRTAISVPRFLLSDFWTKIL